MNSLTRKKVILNGVMKKRENNILEVGNHKYLITDFLAKRIRLKKWVIGSMTFILSLIYLFSIEQYKDITLDEGDSYIFIEGLTTTFLFLFSIMIGFILISVLLIPKDLKKDIKKELF